MCAPLLLASLAGLVYLAIKTSDCGDVENTEKDDAASSEAFAREEAKASASTDTAEFWFTGSMWKPWVGSKF